MTARPARASLAVLAVCAAMPLALSRCGSGIAYRLPNAGCPARGLKQIQVYADVGSSISAEDGVQVLEGLGDPQGVVVSPDGKTVYVTSAGDSTLIAFKVKAAGILEFLQGFDSDGTDYTELPGLEGSSRAAVAADGTSVIVVARYPGTVLNFDRSGNGMLSINQVFDFSGVDGAPNSDINTASTVTIAPSGKYVYVGSENEQLLARFKREAGTGILDPFTPVTSAVLTGVDFVGSIGFSPDGNFAYVPGVASHSLHVVSVSAGDFARVEEFSDHVNADPDIGVNFPGMILPYSASVSPDGRHVYVAAAGDSKVFVFKRSATSGKLKLVQTLRGDDGDGIAGEDEYSFINAPVQVDFTPDGCHALVASRNGDAILLFERDRATGKLTFVKGLAKTAVAGAPPTAVPGLDGVTSIAVSPDGSRVYVTSVEDDALNVLSLD